MGSLFEAVRGAFGGGQDIQFLSSVLAQYREIRKVYHYEYTDEDKAALKACATDLRPVSYAFLPAGFTYWGLGKLVSRPQQLGGMTRIALVLLRLSAASEVLRVGYLVGSYRQGMDCTRRLVSLRSPLGGEIAAIIRDRDPQHPLLKQERPPGDLGEDGSRPRIVSEANRLAQIKHLRAELAAAKAGTAGRPEDRVNRSADEFLFSIMRQREADIEEMQQAGGPAAAVSGGRLEDARPQRTPSYQEQYATAAAAGVSAGMGSGSLAGVARGGGLVITDEPPASPEASAQLQQRAAQLAAAAVRGAGGVGAGDEAGSSGSSGSASASGSEEDPLAMLLGGSWGEEESEEARQRAAEEEARLRKRTERRKRWWRKGGRSGEEEGGGW